MEFYKTFFGRGVTGAHVRMRNPFLYLGNGWTDCAETWGVVRGPLAMRFTKDEGYLHERTCNCTHIEAHLFAPARSSPNRRLTGCKMVSIFLRHVVVAWFSFMDNRKSFVNIVGRMYFIMEFALAVEPFAGQIFLPRHKIIR